jgi:hypothetical protein
VDGRWITSARGSTSAGSSKLKQSVRISNANRSNCSTCSDPWPTPTLATSSWRLSTTHADRHARRRCALHCCRAGTGSSNAQVWTGQETETRTCQEREKGQEVSADASQAAEEGETIIDGRIISCSPIALTRCVWQVGEYTAAVNCIISCVSQLEKHLMAVNI